MRPTAVLQLVRITRKHMQTVGVISGSFDPITNGHAWLVEEAALLVDELHIVMAVNPDKKYSFPEDQRLDLVKTVIADLNLPVPVTVHVLGQVLLVDFAKSIGANRLIRGLRNAEDLAYERRMAQINRKLTPEIPTIYVASPAALSDLSSSSVRGLLGFEGWERIVSDHVHPAVMAALVEKASK